MFLCISCPTFAAGAYIHWNARKYNLLCHFLLYINNMMDCFSMRFGPIAGGNVCNTLATSQPLGTHSRTAAYAAGSPPRNHSETTRVQLWKQLWLSNSTWTLCAPCAHLVQHDDFSQPPFFQKIWFEEFCWSKRFTIHLPCTISHAASDTSKFEIISDLLYFTVT